MLVRAKFPQIYETKHHRGGVFWVVSARSKEWNLNERKTFNSKKRAEEYAESIRERINKFGAQPNIPHDKIIKSDSYDQLTKEVRPFGVSLEEAVEFFKQAKAAEIIKESKPFIRDLAEQWKAFKYSKKGLSSRFVTEIKSYTLFIKRQWGDMKPDEIRKNDIELMLNELNISNNTRKKYLLFIRMFFK